MTARKKAKPSRKAKPKKKTVKRKAPKKKPAKRKAKKKPAKRVAKRKPAKKKRNPAKKKAKKTVKKKQRKVVKKQKGKVEKTKEQIKRRTIKKKLRKQLQKSVMEQQKETKRRRTKRVKRHPILPLGQSKRVDNTIIVLKELRKKNKISDWKITMVHVKKANLYMGKSFKEETTLRGQRKDIVATVYTKNKDGTMGESKMPILEPGIREIRQRLNEAVSICGFTKQQPFNIPSPQGEVEMPECHDEEMFQTFMGDDRGIISQGIAERTKNALARDQNILINCFEILTSASTTRIINSNGFDISYHKTLIYYELTLSTEGTNGTQEFTYRAKAVSPAQLNLSIALPEQAEIVKDVANAETCEEFDGDVLLAGRSLVDFFTPDDNINPVLLHTFARMKILGVNRFELDERLGEFQGEPFSISTNPHLPRGVHTMPVDEDGTPLKHTELIRNGIMVNHVAPARDAQYLGVPATGMLTNVQVGDGATREEHLRGQNYIEIASFSWFLPDPYSGDFSAEIRLGYKWFRGKKTPFKGGHLTGNVFKQLLNARFSREIIQSGSYYGPRAVMFKEGKVTGHK